MDLTKEHHIRILTLYQIIYIAGFKMFRFERPKSTSDAQNL